MKLRTLALFAIPLSFWASFQVCASGIGITNAYVRAVPPGQPNSAAFMTLTNTDAQGHALVSATSDVAATVELHTHVQEDGMMKMREIERIAIPANQEVRLQPGGLHIMLIGLHQPLSEGQQVTLHLHFEDGSQQEISAPVRPVMPPASMSMKMNQ